MKRSQPTVADIGAYDEIIGMLVNMQNHPDKWSITKR